MIRHPRKQKANPFRTRQCATIALRKSSTFGHGKQLRIYLPADKAVDYVDRVAIQNKNTAGNMTLAEMQYSRDIY